MRPRGFFQFLRDAIAVVLLTAAAMAATAAHAQMTQVPLTGAIVQSFMASFPDVKKTAESLSAKYGERDGSDVASTFGAWMAVADAQSALNGSVKAHGFDNFSTWVQVLTSVANAYAFAKGGAEMDAGMADAIAQIKNNPSLSAAQKEMMLQQMQAASSSMTAMRPPQANIDAVTPYVAQLAAVFDDQ